MGITLAAFVNGDVMDPAVVTTRLTTIRDWMNGGIVTNDIVASTVPTRAFKRMDHFLAVNPRSVGVTGTTTRGTVTTDPVRRTYATIDSHGPTWADIATMSARVTCATAGYVEAVFEWWCWAIQSDQGNPEALNQCDFRLKFDGTAVEATRRTLMDSGHDLDIGAGAAQTDGGQWCYPARNFQAIVQRPVVAGYATCTLQINCVAQATATARYRQALIIIGARNRHLEYWSSP